MKQRELRDPEGTTWTCAQAFSSLGDAVAEEAAERVQTAPGRVPVVCTPSGGAETVRLELAPDWDEQLTDDDLLDVIRAVAGR